MVRGKRLNLPTIIKANDNNYRYVNMDGIMGNEYG